EQGLAEATRVRAGAAPVDTDPVRAEIAAIWARCLRHDRFTAQDSFFDVGGDSLDAIMVISELQARGYRMSSRAFLERPTIEALAAVVSQRQREDAPAHVEHDASASIAYVPRELDLGAQATRQYAAVLLTGATGHIGAHALHELLVRTSAHIHCLVR